MMNRKNAWIAEHIIPAFTAAFIFVLSGCYSVFTGGVGGTIVDSESTSIPKAGIPNVKVYAYISEEDRDADFNSWKEDTLFTPNAEYYGTEKTDAEGDFSLSKIVWKSYWPVFGKDADVQQIYLLFYHENYGLTKGGTLIVSDSISDAVYQELTKIKKTTNLQITMMDVTTNSAAAVNVEVKITVPQSSEKNPDAAPKIYNANITGAGIVPVTYPRWQNDSDKENGIETKPQISIQYYQSAEEITWKACLNDTDNEDYSFLEDNFSLTKKIRNDSYDINLYGKPTKIKFPIFSGYWGTENGIILTLLHSKDDGLTYTENCGTTETKEIQIGNQGTTKNGYFVGLGTNSYYTNETYTGKIATTKVRITDGITNKDFEIRSDQTSRNVQQ